MSHRKVKERLWKEDPHCHWCGCETVIINQAEFRKGNPPPDNLATVDHVFSRYHPERWLINGSEGIRKRVLSCIKCNQIRARKEEASLSLKELHRRSYGFSLTNVYSHFHNRKKVVDTV